MKFGINCNLALGAAPAADDVLRFAARVEELGFHSFAVSDHVVIPREFDPASYPVAGGFVGSAPWYDPYVLLAAVAGCTRHIILSTGITVVPYRPPVQQAQAIATLDFISGGRYVHGIGLGWMREEYDALEVPFEERAARTREYIEIMKLLWSGSDAPYRGRFLDFPGGRINPLPVSRPHPPILVGGDGPPAYRRIVELGDGFLFNFKLLPAFRATLAELGPMMRSAGRDLAELRMQFGTTDLDLLRSQKSHLPEFEALGLEEIVLSLNCLSAAEGFRQVEAVAREFLP